MTSTAEVVRGDSVITDFGDGEVCPLVNTHTTCMFGVFNVKVGTKIMTIMVMLDGLMSVWIWFSDFCHPDSTLFRWGPRGWEVTLQTLNMLIGLSSVLIGASALRYCDKLNARGLHRFRNFVTGSIVWTVAWHLCVGLPVDIVYASVPAVQTWPLSSMPGMPRHDVIDPEWPYGRPSVCTDVWEAKRTLADELTKHRKNTPLGKVLHAVYKRIFKRVIPCSQVQKIFWGFMVVSLCWRAYAVHLSEYFYKVVKHGGDGKMMIGKLSDLDKPIDSKAQLRELVDRQLEFMFQTMDTDGDGKVSIEELRGYLRTNSALYQSVELQVSDWRSPP